MSAEQDSLGRRSTDADFAAVVEWRRTVDEKLDAIHNQTRATNGRVSELEVKERIRQDREEQKAIRDAASEAAKYRIEQKERDDAAADEEHDAREAAHADEQDAVRKTWKTMIRSAVIGALAGALFSTAGSLIVLALTHHL